MKTQENNKLIAEFMGMQQTDIGWYDNEETLQLRNNTFDELQYHKDWNWLMGVIRKINEVSEYNDYCKDRLHLQRVLDECINENTVGIDEVCKAVVQFINQYNKNK